MDGCGKSPPPISRDSNPLTVLPVANRYTDYAISAHKIHHAHVTLLPYPKCSQSAVGHRDITEVCRHTLLRSCVSKRTTFHRPLHQRFILHMSRPLMNCGPNYLVLWHPHQRDLLSFLLIVVRNNYKVPVTLKPCIANPSINVAFVIPWGAYASVRVTKEH
jgi:hypothetical protein